MEDTRTEPQKYKEEEKIIEEVEELLHYTAMRHKLNEKFAKFNSSFDGFLSAASKKTGIAVDNILFTVSCAYNALDDEEAYKDMPKDEPHFSDMLISILSLVGKEKA